MAAIKMGVLMNNQLSEICSDSIVSMVKKGVRRFKRPEVGDLFTLEMQDIGFIHGMVARNDLEFVKGQADFNIVYIYKEITKNQSDNLSLAKSELMFPPFIVNDMAWRQGYFQTYDSIPISEIDVFNEYCFYSKAKKQYENERWESCKAFEPCSDLVLSSSLTIAIKIYMRLNPKMKILD